MIYIVKIGNKEYEVEVEKGKANIVKTEITAEPAKTAPEAAPKTAPAPVPGPDVPDIPAGGELIKAPMPGTILDIKVSAGTSVKKGDILVILEAMKMENELVAPADGVIAQVLIEKGASVATDDALILMR